MLDILRATQHLATHIRYRPQKTNKLVIQNVHGSLARAGKVKSQTPKVEKTEKPKKPKGRAYKRLLYTRRFVNVTLTNGKRKMNPSPNVS
ncbi:40S ribosomal protein eS30 RPS30A PWA37_002147 [Arxiozyma heterogenica]|uniref:40S ribosomal protein eS30 RPS30A n=1 Tax=Arxiozyma heterogenica TaxID=278026 RepID=UPI002EFD180F